MSAITITHSDISMFLQCRRKWAWSYVQDFQKKEGKTGPLALGTRVHASLEEYYRDGADPLVVHDRLAREALADVLDDPHAAPWDEDNLYEDIILGRNCLIAHQEWLADTGADSMFEVAAVEGLIEAPILDGRVILRGKVDVLFKHIETGDLWVMDLKTSGAQVSGIREILERSYQHHVYLTLARLNNPDGPHIAGAMYTVMKKVRNLDRATTPVVERFRAPAVLRTGPIKLRQIERICTEMLMVMESLETEGNSVAYPSPQQACKYCEFKQPCEVADENPLAARSMLDTLFVRGSRHKRYDT